MLGAMSTPLLTTKLHIPPARQSGVHRPILIDLLNGGASGKLTLISAPAGFGKTTLMAERATGIRSGTRVEEQPVNRVAWLSPDNGDNDHYQFIYLVFTTCQLFHTRSMGRAYETARGSFSATSRNCCGHV
jgi:LuxR family transcriptional regulator, maltose regulon positive regulatory protein